MNQKWKDMTSLQKAGIILVFVGAALLLAANLKPELFPVDMSTPAIAIVTVGEAMDYWQKDKKWAWLFIGAAVISMACFLVGLFLL